MVWSLVLSVSFLMLEEIMLDCCALNLDELRADVCDITIHFIKFLLKFTGSISCSIFGEASTASFNRFSLILLFVSVSLTRQKSSCNEGRHLQAFNCCC
jgi:hypothetical protein